EQRRHLALHLPVRRHRGRPPARRARAGEHLRQPDLRRHVGLGARRYRRPRAHRDRRHAQQGVQCAVRRRRDELLGGILPGILCVIMLMLMTGWLALRRKYPRTERWPTRGELWRDFKPALPAILAPVILIAGMLMGFFTPTEIASVTVLYALLMSSLFYRELTWKGILDASY